eukprot:jgi/Ulvmu1/8229/UM041_0038.1
MLMHTAGLTHGPRASPQPGGRTLSARVHINCPPTLLRSWIYRPHPPIDKARVCVAASFNDDDSSGDSRDEPPPGDEQLPVDGVNDLDDDPVGGLPSGTPHEPQELSEDVNDQPPSDHGFEQAGVANPEGDNPIDSQKPTEVEGDIVAEGEGDDKSAIPGLFDDDDFNIDELVNEEAAADAEVEDVLEQIGFKAFSDRKEESVAEETRMFEYPEPPERSIKFGALLKKCGYAEDVIEQYTEVAEIEITGIQTDSRLVEAGNLFVCIEGAHADGHHFIPDAISNGCALIVAQMRVPGAELALYTDASPVQPELSELYQEPFYQMADNDIMTMEACSEEMSKVFDKMEAFGEVNGLNEEDVEKLQVEGAMRNISSALNYDFSHWENRDEQHPSDEDLTPHPFNPLIPIEINTPVTWAIDPADFVATLSHGFYDRPSERLTTVGVTGTNGKTTVAWLMRSIFEQLGQLTGMIGTVEYSIATDRLDIEGDLWEPYEEDTTLSRECSTPFWGAPYEGKYEVPCTTPDNVSIQKLMAGMADRGATACVMECSSIGLDQGRVDLVDFDVAIFTNLGRDHLDYHEDIDEYKNCKAHLFSMLSESARQRAVINIDDPVAQDMANAGSQVPVVTYSFENPEADVYSKSVKFSVWETSMTIHTPLGTMEIITPLIGRPNVYNILACVAASISINIDLKDVAAALENAEVVPGRFELIDEGQDFVALVDYAHTPDALNGLLDAVRECTDRKRIILVFGCGGDRDTGKRAYMGEIAHYKADIVILTNDNPRSEPPEEIIDDIVDGYPEEVRNAYEPSSYDYMVDVGRVPPIFEKELLERQGEQKRYVIEDRFCAIRAAIAIAQKNDVVIIAGKGHEDYIEYADVNGSVFKAWFDDRVEARNALTKLPYLDRIPYLNRKNLPLERK